VATSDPEDRNSRTVKMQPVGPDGDGVYRSQIGREPRTDAPAGKPRERSRTIGEIHNDTVASRRADRFEYQDRGAEGVDVRDTGGGVEGNLENTITRERAKDNAPRLTREQTGAAKTAREDFNDAVTAAKADASLDPNPKEHTTVELKTARGHVTHYQVERTPEALDRLHERVNKLPDHAFYSRDLHAEEAPAGYEDEARRDNSGTATMCSAISRATRCPKDLLKDGMDADRAFNWIAENSKDEFHRQLANTLVDLTEGVKISPTTRRPRADLRDAHGAVIHKGKQARIFINTSSWPRADRGDAAARGHPRGHCHAHRRAAQRGRQTGGQREGLWPRRAPHQRAAEASWPNISQRLDRTGKFRRRTTPTRR
jgi:hypothetical protein